MVITDFKLEYLWQNRNEMIQVGGYLLEGKEVHYVIEVLRHMRQQKFFQHDIYISTRSILEKCLEGMKKEKTSMYTAERLLQMNKTIGDVA